MTEMLSLSFLLQTAQLISVKAYQIRPQSSGHKHKYKMILNTDSKCHTSVSDILKLPQMFLQNVKTNRQLIQTFTVCDLVTNNKIKFKRLFKH